MREAAAGGEYAVARRRLAERLAEQGVRDARVLEAISLVPRHRMIPEALRGQAYRDAALPIGDGQSISAPSTVAAISEALELRGGETVLEIGTGSAYQAAILSRLAARVISVERLPGLAARATPCSEPKRTSRAWAVSRAWLPPMSPASSSAVLQAPLWWMTR